MFKFFFDLVSKTLRKQSTIKQTTYLSGVRI